MKAIVSMTDEEYDALNKIYTDLMAKIKEADIHKIVNASIKTTSGYAHFKFSGQVPKELYDVLGRMPTPDELIMLADSGIRNFGAECSVSKSGAFSGRVNTD